jgi:putative membrane protein
MEPLVAYLHYLAIVLIAGFLVAEIVVCRPSLDAERVRLLPRLDIVFFAGALLALATGLLRLFYYAKGVAFYLPNPFFIVKMALYVVIASLSIKPTMAFLRWRRRLDASGALPPAAEIASARRLIHVEVALLALMPLMAVLMARGIGR